MDISNAAVPDVKGDCKHLPFKDEAFDAIYCDPPHLVGGKNTVWAKDKGNDGHMAKGFQRFSFWPDLTTWRTFARESTTEFRRVLKPNGLLRWKLMDGARSHGRVINYEAVLGHDGFTLIADVTVFSEGPLARTNAKRWGSYSLVHYLTLRRNM